MAAAERDLESGGSQEDCDSAILEARAVRAAALKAAKDQSIATHAAAEGQRQIALAQAALIHAQAIGPAGVAWAQQYSSAELAHVTSRTADRVAAATAIATATSAYNTSETASLSTAMAAFATLHPSPWATHTSDTANARHDRTMTRKGEAYIFASWLDKLGKVGRSHAR